MGSFFGKMSSPGGNYFESKTFKEKDLKTADTLFVDMRDKEEFEESHIRTSLHLPLPQVGTNKTQLEKIFAESGIQELLLHFHAREDPLTLILYSSRPSSLLEISRLLYYHKEFFSSFSHQLYILEEGFPKLNKDILFSTIKYRESELENKKEPTNGLIEIIDKVLFLSDFKSGSDIELLEKKKIDIIINVSSEMFNPDSGRNYQHISLGENGEVRFLETLNIIIDLIDENLTDKNKVLVICEEGTNKSVASILGFLMQFQRCNLLTAYRYVKEKLPKARPTIQIMRYLLELESLLLPGTIPSFPLRLYISFYQDYEPFEDSLDFINYLDTYEKYLLNFGQFENMSYPAE